MDKAHQFKEIVSFLKELFGDDFKLKGVSYCEGEIEYVTETSDMEHFFTCSLNKTTIWYNPFEGILYSYKPQEDSFFKKITTNAWGFKYVFYPIFIEDWYWWSHYHFDVYEKGKHGKYKFIKRVD